MPPEDDDLIEVAAASAPAPEPTPQATPPATPATPKHSKATLRLAADFGITQEEIDASSADRLDDRVDDLLRWHQQQRELDRTFEAANPRVSITRADDSPSLPARESTERARAPAPTSEPDVKLGLREEDGWDKGLLSELRTIKGEAQKEIAALKKEIEGFKQERAQEQQHRVYDTYDSHFAKHPEIYGKGSRKDKLAEHELKRRLFVIQATNRDPGQFESFHSTVYGLGNVAPGAVAPGLSTVPTDGESPRDSNGRFVKQEQPKAEPKTEPKAPYSTQDWEQAALRQPSQRAEAPLTGVAAAKKAYRDGYRQVVAADGDEDSYAT